MDTIGHPPQLNFTVAPITIETDETRNLFFQLTYSNFSVRQIPLEYYFPRMPASGEWHPNFRVVNAKHTYLIQVFLPGVEDVSEVQIDDTSDIKLWGTIPEFGQNETGSVLECEGMQTGNWSLTFSPPKSQIEGFGLKEVSVRNGIFTLQYPWRGDKVPLANPSECTKKLEDSKKKIEDYEQELKDSKKKIEDYEQERKDSKKKIEDYEQELKDLKKKIEDYEQELKDSKKKIEKFQALETCVKSCLFCNC